MRGAEAVAHREAPRKRDVGGRRGGREGKIGMICGPTSRRLPGKRDRGRDCKWVSWTGRLWAGKKKSCQSLGNILEIYCFLSR